MTTIATLLILGVFAYLVYRYLLQDRTRSFRLELFRPPGPLTDRTRSYYEDQRQYADLVAVYGRADVPDPDLAVQREVLVEPPVSIEAARQVRDSKANKASCEKLDRPA